MEDSLYDNVKAVLDKIPRIKHLIWSDQGLGQPAAPDFIDFNGWYKQAPATEPDVILRIEDPVQMTYTSGTESLPKGVIISNQSLIAQYMGCIIDGKYDNNDININALPIYHCAQRDVFLNPIFWLGGTNILMSPDIGKILAAIETWKATMFFAPPTVWIGMLRHPDFERMTCPAWLNVIMAPPSCHGKFSKNSWKNSPEQESITITARPNWLLITPS